jgi:PKD repeat protein
MSRLTFALACAALLTAACNSTNPVAPTDNSGGSGGGGGGNGGGGSASVTVTVASDHSQLEAGSTTGATLTVTARRSDGSPATESEAVLNTSLGNFGTDGAGNPIQLIHRPLSGGVATVSLFPGTQLGTARILAQVGTGTGNLNVPIVQASAPPVADFSFEVSGLSVLFLDTSTGDPTAWSWDFGDGTVSTEQSPLHNYSIAGSYTVSLTVTAAGGVSSRRKFVTVEAGVPLIADFSFAVDGLSVLFTDHSAGTPTTYLWDFGDGGASGLRNPQHVYTRAGTYTVMLTVVNQFGTRDSASKFVTVSQGTAPVASFSVQTAGLSAAFTDTSTGSPTAWSWDFGDSSGSTAQNPTHTYAQAGSYSVTLRASNLVGSSSRTQFVTVTLGDPPVADFQFQANGLTVVFADRSTGRPTSWSWDFGCAGSACRSTEQNPTFVYPQSGSYTVTLTATNAAGSSRAVKLVTVSDAQAPVADFCVQRNGHDVIFRDASSGNPTTWSWNFGDCSTSPSTCQSTARNPGHTYAADGTYLVQLTVTNAAGTSSASKFVPVSAATVDSAPQCVF